MADYENSAQQRKAADRRDRQRHPGAVARGLVMMPVADQQEGEDAGEFPEHDQEDQVAGEHNAQHRPHERQEEKMEAADGILRRDVVARIDDDEKPYPADKRRENP